MRTARALAALLVAMPLALAQVISEDDFDMLFPHKSCSWSPDGDKANYYYSYENLVKAYHRVPFPSSPAVDIRLEWAAFLANVKYESGDLCYIKEWRCTGQSPQPDDCDYCEESGKRKDDYPCSHGQQYYARGPLQVAWNYNYGDISELFYGDRHKLLDDPSLMETDGELGWTSALWYWAENSHTRFAHYPGSDGGFGAVTQDMDEDDCHEGESDDNQHKRVGYYQDFAKALGLGWNDMVNFNLYCTKDRGVVPVGPSTPTIVLPQPPADGGPPVGCNKPTPAGYTSVFSMDDKPRRSALTDGRPLALGMRFTTVQVADVTAVRYFKSEKESASVHEGKIYNWATGELLGTTGPFYDKSCKGCWVRVALQKPVRLAPKTQYVVAIDGLTYYAKTSQYFLVPKRSGTISGFAGVFGIHLGVMPKEVNMGTANYWTDVEIMDAKSSGGHKGGHKGGNKGDKVTSTSNGNTGVVPPPAPIVPADDSDSGSDSGSSGNGRAVVACNKWPAAGTQTFFTPTEAPNLVSRTDSRRLVLGMRFYTTAPGDITAIRFYKATMEDGREHEGKIYDFKTGQLLATTGKFSDKDCPGPKWVSASLGTPFRTTANTEYVVAVDSVLYYAKSGRYFSNGDKTSGLIVAKGSAYGYGKNSVPSNVDQAIVNYWVDMEFTPVKTPKKSRELKDKGNQGEPRTARRRIMDRRGRQ